MFPGAETDEPCGCDWAKPEPQGPKRRNKRARQNVIAQAFLEIVIKAAPNTGQSRTMPTGRK